MMTTLADHIRRLWAERDHCINPKIPTDLPEHARKLASSDAWHEARMKRAGEIDAEFGAAIKAMRELGITG